MKNKKIPIIIASVMVIIVVVVSIVVKSKGASADEVTVTKETTVQKGNITSGVTESGSVTVGTNSMTFDLDLSANSSTNSSTSSSSNSASSGNAGGTSSLAGNGNGNTGTSGSQTGGSMGMSSPSGTTTPSASTGSSTSTTSGCLVVDTVYAAVGQTVAVGDKLMSLTKDSVADARATLKEGITNAELALTEAKITDKQIKITAESTYNLNVALGKNAKSVYNATLSAINSNISSLKEQIANTTDTNKLTSLKAQLSQAQNEESSKKLEAKQTYELAVMNYENAKSTYDVAMAEYGTATKEAEEALASAKEKLTTFDAFVGSDYTICSTYAGSIAAIGYAHGDSLSTETPIAQFADVSAVTVSENVTQDDIAAVNLGDTVNVELISDSANVYQGTVSAIDSAVTTSTAVSYPVTVVLSSMPKKVLTGMTASVTFISKEVQDVLYVSNKAIFTEGTKSYVNVKQENGTVTKTEVTTGFSNGENVEIASGLTEGATVLIESKVNSQ